MQNRLAKVTTENEDGDKHIVEYTYNDEGIRVQAYTYDIPYGQSIQNEKTVVYLVDEYNHTGYAQTLEEKTYNGTDTSGTPDSLTTYLIGDDVIAQTKDTNTQYLLYDGHGSTRQLAEYDTSVTIADSYSYDGYGVLLQDDAVAQNAPGKVSQQATSLLYTGEHFDTDSQQYYNRARWYDSLNGRFNRVDPYSGNTQDPQSLHKYLYCHANPVNGIDPTGLTSLLSVTITSAIIGALIGGLIGGIDSALGGGSFWKGFGWGALFGGIAGAASVFLPMTLLIKALLGGVVVTSSAIGAFSSFKNKHYLQGFFRIIIGLVSLGLLVKAPTRPSTYKTISQQRALENMGFSIAEAEKMAAGKVAISRIGNPGGKDTIIASQFADGRLRVGIVRIIDKSGTGTRAFGSFRRFAFDIARAYKVKEFDMFGAGIENPRIETMLIRQGFKPAIFDECSVLMKTVKVPN